jgi:catechol 2,3-dioxygenase-like lactoylglutathione lyase family enzyme
MSESGEFQVEQIDHVELYVPGRFAAASWYQKVLGLEIVAGYEHWADNLEGPLMISSDGGRTKLALFRGPSQAGKDITGIIRVAFRVDAAGFIDFLASVPRLGLKDRLGRTVTADLVKDHDQSFSIYFCDPYGNLLEVTTYDYQELKKTWRY